jgi:hypothetical protein
VASVSRGVAEATAQRERNKWLAMACAVALAVSAAVGGLGGWLGRLDRDQAVVEIKAPLPAMTASAKAFDRGSGSIS